MARTNKTPEEKRADKSALQAARKASNDYAKRHRDIDPMTDPTYNQLQDAIREAERR